ncbi:MAG: tRNA A-37 threonylcarbamoyl transferase component Bud32 [Chlamydiales bacterium]|jgi:tRNA A-37 threonylcarbamoyl transferase component Bud32
MTWRDRWQFCGTDAATAALRGLLATRDQGEATEIREAVDFLRDRAWVKGSVLRGSGARRHGIAHMLWRRRVPRIAEYQNLTWLRDHGFGAARPLAAAVRWSGLLPCYQVLATEYVEGARPVADHLGPDSVDARAILTELGREVARMHSLHFVHHDLFFRNLLVLPAGGEHRVVFLDAWSGGRFRSLRGPSYDLACLYSDCGPALAPQLQVHLLEAYLSGCREHGRRVDRDALVTAVDRQRARLSPARGAERSLRRTLDAVDE